MKVYLNSIDGIADAFVSMYISKRTWTRELEVNIRRVCDSVLDRHGFMNEKVIPNDYYEFTTMLDTLLKWGKRHITMLRYIDFSVTVDGMHRGGQDDFDSHAKRLENRIMRSSTRLADFNSTEKSDWYKGKILYPFEALELAGVKVPKKVIMDGDNYLLTDFGYIRQDLVNNRDVKRGLYPLAIPSTFTFKVNLTEFSHICKERDANSNANPEVRLFIEELKVQIRVRHEKIIEVLYDIKN